MGTEILKIEEEITEKMKPKVAAPPKWAEFSAYTFIDKLDMSKVTRSELYITR